MTHINAKKDTPLKIDKLLSKSCFPEETESKFLTTLNQRRQSIGPLIDYFIPQEFG